jgi:lycopene beta-cyclase
VTIPDYDLILIGAGLANTAIVLSLLEKNYTGRILILEQQPDFPKQRTWCFWQHHLLPSYLQHLIANHWDTWGINYQSKRVKQTCEDKRYAYCCIKGEDYYQYCHRIFQNAHTVTLMFNQTVESVNDNSDGLTVNHNNTHTTSNYLIDSRIAPQNHCSKTIKQSFVGAWVHSKKAIFDQREVSLMDNLQTVDNQGISFYYILPFSAHNALIEYTTFSNAEPDFNHLTMQTMSLLQNRWQLSDEHITDWEQGCLPMSVNTGSSTITHSKYALSGIAKGNIRPSTGYAFLINHRWAEKVSKAIISEQSLPRSLGYSSVYSSLDKLFLSVIKNDMTLAPTLFFDLLAHTNADTFARFMTESARPKDILAVLSALPSKPFLKALLWPHQNN